MMKKINIGMREEKGHGGIEVEANKAAMWKAKLKVISNGQYKERREKIQLSLGIAKALNKCFNQILDLCTYYYY